MAVHLVLVACLAAPPNTCQEIALPEVVSEDVIQCIGSAKAKSEEWQTKHTDYLVIATKCAKDEGSATPPPPPPANSN
jgi:hypothetical protein